MKLSDWKISTAEVDSLCAGASLPETLKACGCGVKLDLQEIVYPTLAEFEGELGTRCDSAEWEGTLGAHERKLWSSAALPQRTPELSKSIYASLVSLEAHYYSDPELSRSKFRKLTSFVHEILRANPRLRAGKSHSIEAGGDFLLMDCFDAQKAPGIATHVNNDTLITADSLLKSSSKISVFTALNNALNDLFVSGVIENLRVFPVMDESHEEIEHMRRALDEFADYYRNCGVEIQIEPVPPLRLGLTLIGATVTGTTKQRATRFSELRPGDDILVTRKLGDLSVLALHRELFREKKPVPRELVSLRHQVLSRFMTSNFPIGAILKRYLPNLGEASDPKKHVSFSSDLSGPGISVLEEAALASQVDVQIDQLEFLNPDFLGHYRRNHTSSTNGPILIAGHPEVLMKLQMDLEQAGYNELWRLGSVLRKSENPTVWIHSDLRRLGNETNPRLDFFAPEVHFAAEKRRIPILRTAKFLD